MATTSGIRTVVNDRLVDGAKLDNITITSPVDLNQVEGDLSSHIANTSNPHNTTKTQVGLGNVDNTSDLNKPISTATQTALNAKVNTSTTVNGKALSSNVILTTDDVGEGSTNKYDKVVALIEGAGIEVTGTYPNFTITNSSPDEVVALTAGTNVTITGVYPNFTINSTGGGGGGGDVFGPSSSIDDGIALFNGTTGKLIKDSSKTIVTTLGVDDSTIPTSNAVNIELDKKQTVFTGICQEQYLTENDIVIDCTSATPSLTIATVKNGEVISASNPICFYTDGNGIPVKHEVGTPISVNFTYTTGVWYFYFNSSGVLVATQTAWNDFSTIATVYRLYLNSTLSGDLRNVVESVEYHKNDISWSDHAWKHSNGTIWVEGMEITNNKLASGAPNGDGRNTCISLSSGTCLDDNLFYTLTSATGGTTKFTQDLGEVAAGSLNATNSGIFKIRGNDSLGRLVMQDGTRFPFSWDVATNRPEFITSTGVRTLVTGGNFFVYYVYALQDPRRGETIKIVSAEVQFTSANNASAHSWENLQAIYPTLRDNEIRLLYKLTFEYRASYLVGCKYSVLRTVDDLRKQKTTTTAIASGSLPATSVTNIPSGNIASTNIQDAINELDSEKLTNSVSTNKLLGRGTAGTGVIEEITLGTNLSLTGTTLNAAGGGGFAWGATATGSSGVGLSLSPTSGATGAYAFDVANSSTAPTNGWIYGVLGNTQTVAHTMLKLDGGTSTQAHKLINLVGPYNGNAIYIDRGDIGIANWAGVYSENGSGSNATQNNYCFQALVRNSAGYDGGLYINNTGTSGIFSSFWRKAGLSINQSAAGGLALGVAGADNINVSTNGLVNYTLSNTQSGASIMQKIDTGTSAQAHIGYLANMVNASTSARGFKFNGGTTFTGAAIELAGTTTTPLAILFGTAFYNTTPPTGASAYIRVSLNGTTYKILAQAE